MSDRPLSEDTFHGWTVTADKRFDKIETKVESIDTRVTDNATSLARLEGYKEAAQERRNRPRVNNGPFNGRGRQAAYIGGTGAALAALLEFLHRILG